MRKVYVNVTMRIIMEMNEDITVDEVISEMDYQLSPMQIENVNFVDTEITDYEVTDSK